MERRAPRGHNGKKFLPAGTWPTMGVCALYLRVQGKSSRVGIVQVSCAIVAYRMCNRSCFDRVTHPKKSYRISQKSNK